MVILATTAVVDTGTTGATTVSASADIFLTIVLAPLSGGGSVRVRPAAVAVYTLASAGAVLVPKRTAVPAAGAAAQ
jgi:hypothetical protein